MVESLTRQLKIKSYWIAPGIGNSSDITPETLKEAICRVFGTEPDKLLGKDRDEATADAKHFYRWFLDKYYNMSDPSIAMLSNCSRSNVLCSVKKASELMEFNKSFQDKASQIIDKWEAGLIMIENRMTVKEEFLKVFELKEMKRYDSMRHLFRYILYRAGIKQHIIAQYSDCHVSKIVRSIGIAKNIMSGRPEIESKCEMIIQKIEKNEIILPGILGIKTNQLNKAQQIREQYERYYPNEK